jgi:hypothetical protein
VAGEEVLDHGAGQGGVAGGWHRAGSHVGLTREVDQLDWLGLRGVGLGDADQLAQVVGLAEGVQAGVDGVGRPVVVTRVPRKWTDLPSAPLVASLIVPPVAAQKWLLRRMAAQRAPGGSLSSTFHHRPVAREEPCHWPSRGGDLGAAGWSVAWMALDPVRQEIKARSPSGRSWSPSHPVRVRSESTPATGRQGAPPTTASEVTPQTDEKRGPWRRQGRLVGAPPSARLRDPRASRETPSRRRLQGSRNESQGPLLAPRPPPPRASPFAQT